MNIQGLAPQTIQSKVSFISDIVVPEQQLFFGLSETWLNNHREAELSIEGYTIFRCDSTRKKKSSRGRFTGGVALYVRDDIAISTEVLVSFSSNAVQTICLYSKPENLVMTCLYRQPDDKTHGNPSTHIDLKTALSRLMHAIGKLNPSPDIIFGGDFNIPHVKWPEGTPAPKASTDEKLMLNHLNEFCNELFLNQIITQPTHKDGNTLDLLFVNNQSLVHDAQIIPVLHSTSHHSIIQISTAYKADTQSTSQARPTRSMFDALNFFSKDVDWDTILNTLKEVDWTAEVDDKSPDDMLTSFYNECYRVTSESVPVKTPADKRKLDKVHRYRRSLTNRRRRINKRLTHMTSPAQRSKLHAELLDIEKKLQRSHRDSEDYMENKAVESIKANPKYFYSYAKKKAKPISKIGPLLKSKDQLTNDNKEMAELLSNQYASVFSTPKDESHAESEAEANPAKLSDFKFDKSDIEAAIDELSSNAAAGIDGFPAILLKKCKDVLSYPLYMFWRKCLDQGYIPSSLKRSLITPIHKGDSRADPANYRPIALTSHVIKIFEKIIRKHVVEFMNKHNLFNDNQHGFRAGRSCLSQLLEHFDQIVEILEGGANVDVIYLDFAKAFDKLDFKIVLKKLTKMGIEGRVHSWIEAFLTNRFQQVTVNGVKSDPMPVISGVPQGSVIGPLLFLILISDIDKDTVEALVKSFADDTRAAKEIWYKEDVAILQHELSKIYDWSTANNASLNDKKFEGMRLGSNEEIKSDTHYTTPSGNTIEIKKSIKDLGVWLSDDCTFNDHIQKTTVKAKDMISWILRSFKTRKQELMLTLYKMLVLPILEYCSVLWAPLDVGNTQKLDEIQWTFIRKVNSNAVKDYWKRLKDLKLYSLERRRDRYRIIYVWKVLEGHVPNVNSKISSKPHVRLGRMCEIPTVKNGKQSKIINASFPVHGQRLFNTLPKCLRDITGVKLDTFKRALDKYLKRVPDEPQLPGYTAYRRTSSNSLIHMTKFTENLPGCSFSLEIKELLDIAGSA